jgi:hypothetical protein
VSAGLVIPTRFNGPARSANGGFASGCLAERVPGSSGELLARTVEVALREPPPLETVLTVTRQDRVTVLQDGGTADAADATGATGATGRIVAEARLVEDDLLRLRAGPRGG